MSEDTIRCETLDKEDCFVYFTYFYDADNNIRVEVQREPGGFYDLSAL